LAEKKAIRLIAFLLIIIFAFQFTLLLLPSFEGGDWRVPDSKAFILKYAFCDNSTTVIQERQEPLFYPSIIKIYALVEFQIYYQSFSTQCFSNNGLIVNFRKKIGNTISQHFNGSKYKDINIPV